MHLKKASWFTGSKAGAAYDTRLVPCGDQSACVDRGSGAYADPA
jgi:hypothetical protein